MLTFTEIGGELGDCCFGDLHSLIREELCGCVAARDRDNACLNEPPLTMTIPQHKLTLSRLVTSYCLVLVSALFQKSLTQGDHCTEQVRRFQLRA